jgi:integrase
MVQHDPEHRDPLTPQQLAALWRKLDEHPTEPSALAVKLLHLWFTRPGELRAARWADFDLTNTAEIDHMSKPLPVWRVPKEGTKMQTALLVPLSDESLALLEELRKQTGWSEFLFPGRVRKGRKPSSPITKVVWSDFLTRIGHKEFSLHSARATASTLLREQLNQDSELIELQLGHLRRNSVRASYDFASRLPARFEMMKKWSRWIVDRARVADLPAPKKRTA